jgi:Zn-finger nucleic acid-binding protein
MLAFADPRSKLVIDSCPECFGLWFDSEELKIFFESPDLSARILNEEVAVVMLGSGACSQGQNAREKACPACAESLFSSRMGQTEVDYCLSCQGIWLDRCELEALVAAFQAGEPGNLLIVNQLVEGLGTSSRPNPKAQAFLETLDRYRQSLNSSGQSDYLDAR